MKASAAAASVLLLLVVAALPSPSGSSLLPFFDRRQENPLYERLPDPFRVLEHIPFGFDRDDIFAASSTRVDWMETPDSHVIMIDVPGLKREDLKIEVDDNRVLRVSGERKREEERKGEHWHCVERAHGKFWRQFRLPDNADVDGVRATLEDGVLTVTLAKLPPERIKGARLVSIGGEEKLPGGVGEGKVKVEPEKKKVEL